MPKWTWIALAVVLLFAFSKHRTNVKRERAHEAFVKDSLAKVAERVRFVRDSQMQMYNRGPSLAASALAADSSMEDLNRRLRECDRQMAPIRSSVGSAVSYGDTSAACQRLRSERR